VVFSAFFLCFFFDILKRKLKKGGVNTFFLVDGIRGGGEQGRSLWAIFEKKAQYLCR